MTLQLARLVERVKRNFDEKRLTGAVFLDVAQAFDSLWIEGLLFKLNILEYPSYLVKIITSYLHSRTFVAAFQATSKHPALLVKYLETHLPELEIWLREWTISINVG